jgi:hypothetical protein
LAYFLPLTPFQGGLEVSWAGLPVPNLSLQAANLSLKGAGPVSGVTGEPPEVPQEETDGSEKRRAGWSAVLWKYDFNAPVFRPV